MSIKDVLPDLEIVRLISELAKCNGCASERLSRWLYFFGPFGLMAGVEEKVRRGIFASWSKAATRA